MSNTKFTGDPLVSVRNLRISFRLDRQTTFEAVKGISFDIPRDSTVALVGESGIGQVRHVAGDARAAAARELDHRSGERSAVRRTQSALRCRSASCASCAAPTSR